MALTEPLRYDTSSDVKLRLHGSIVRYKGIPVYLQFSGTNNLKVLAKPLRHTDPEIEDLIHSSDVDLDISSPPLGYMNTPAMSVYVQRIPTRKQTQGFNTSSATYIVDNALGNYSNSQIMGWMVSAPIADTITAQYPTGIQVLERLLSNPNIKSAAFHPKFSLMKDDIGLLKLRHMGRSIGFVKPNTNRLMINQEFNNPIFTQILDQQGFEV